MRLGSFVVAGVLAVAMPIGLTSRVAADTQVPVKTESAGAFSTCQDDSCLAYFDSSTTSIPSGYGQGFSWYSQAWPLLPEPIDGLQIGLSSTWISPNNVDAPRGVQQAFCAKSKFQDMRDNSWWGYFQTIEGSLGWWASTRFRTVMPKYAMNGTPDCYNTLYSSPGWTFDDARPVRRDETALVQISNRLLVPPDGMPLTPDSSGGYLGSAWMNLPLPAPGQVAGAAPAGKQVWTLFLNAQNFNGPVTYWLPQAWSAVTEGNELLTGLGLDTNEGHVDNFASEWNSVPFKSSTAVDGTLFTMVPSTMFPIDTEGRTIFTRDVRAYSTQAISQGLSAWQSSGGSLPLSFNDHGETPLRFTADKKTFYQQGDLLPDLLGTVTIDTFEDGAAYGLKWKDQRGTGHLPSTFKKVGNTRVAVPESAIPSALANSAFEHTTDPTYIYQSPSWWSRSKRASRDVTTKLLDGSTVTYRWYRFVDQPALQRLQLTRSQKAQMQRVIVNLHRGLANGSSYISPPKAGSLVTLDPGLLVQPPPGLEFGYVPYVVRQSN